MEQGPQTLSQSLGFVAGIYRAKLDIWKARVIDREPLSGLDTRAGRRDPYPIYEDVRRRGRVVTAFDEEFRATADYELCNHLMRSRDFAVRDPETGIVQGRELGGGVEVDVSMLGANPPDHTRLRKLAAPGFTPRLMRSYEARIVKRVEELLDEAEPTRPLRPGTRLCRSAADRGDHRPPRPSGRRRRRVPEVRRGDGLGARRHPVADPCAQARHRRQAARGDLRPPVRAARREPDGRHRVSQVAAAPRTG